MPAKLKPPRFPGVVERLEWAPHLSPTRQTHPSSTTRWREVRIESPAPTISGRDRSPITKPEGDPNRRSVSARQSRSDGERSTLNGQRIAGGVLGAAQLVGYSPWLAFAAGILPHGLFELTAIFLATAAMLKLGAQLVTPQTDQSLGEILLLSLADWFRVFIGIVLPFLAIAALIEIYITPVLIQLAFPYL